MRWKFKATLLKRDERTGFRKGHVIRPKGFYYNGKSVILVGNESLDVVHTPSGDTIRLAFPADTVDIEVMLGVRWGVWMAKDAACGGWRLFDSEEDAETKAAKFREFGYKCKVRRLK